MPALAILDRHSYRHRAVACNSATWWGLAILVALAVVASGCSSSGMGIDAKPVGSVQATSSPVSASDEPVSPSDWEAVRRTIATIPADQTGAFAWDNPDTKSSGVVSVLPTASAETGEACRDFATTINDTRGIRRYRGQACRTTSGAWQLSDLAAEDSKLL